MTCAKLAVLLPVQTIHWECAGFEDMEGAPATFVLMGNFRSPTGTGKGATDPAALRTEFAALAGLLSQYPNLQVSCYLAMLLAHIGM